MYLIDGYNLLYQSSYTEAPELVNALDKFCEYYGKRALVIFDGHSKDDLSTNSVQVEYHDNADDYLAEYMDEHHGGLTLVSSDNEVIASAHRNKVAVVKSDAFDFTIPDEFEDAGDKGNVSLSDDEVDGQLREFNNFRK